MHRALYPRRPSLSLTYVKFGQCCFLLIRSSNFLFLGHLLFMLVALTRTLQLCVGMLARVAARTRVKSRRVACRRILGQRCLDFLNRSLLLKLWHEFCLCRTHDTPLSKVYFTPSTSLMWLILLKILYQTLRMSHSPHTFYRFHVTHLSL